MKAVILSWLLNDGTRGFSKDQLNETTFAESLIRCSSHLQGKIPRASG